MYQVVKIYGKYFIQNTKTGQLLRKFSGDWTKEDAEKECKLRNRIHEKV